MDKKGLLLSLSLLCGATCAAVAWWLAAESRAPGLAPPATDPGAAAAATATEGSRTTDATDPHATAAELRSTVAAATADTPRPLPDDARWIEVRVVDATTHAAVAGADVGWVMEAPPNHARDWSRGDSVSRIEWDSIERQVEQRGWRTTTDAEGIARVTLRRFTTVVAASGDRFGQLDLFENTVVPPGGHVIELGPEQQLTVRVEDDLGAPAPGVLVAIGSYDDAGTLQSFWGIGALACSRAPDGIALLPHLRQRLAQEQADSEPTPPRQLRVRTYVPGFDDPGVVFVLGELPTEPIVLRLPPCGSARVRAEFGGRVAPGFARAMLEELVPADPRGDRPSDATVLRSADADGWVRFPHLPVGRRFEATSWDNGRLTADFAGPVARGQEVTVVITPRSDALHVRGRLVDETRQALAQLAFQIQAWGEHVHAFAEFQTDADGAFLVGLGPTDDVPTDTRLRILQGYTAPMARSVELPPRTLRPGIEDLGEITLSLGDLLVSGRFVDDAGRACADVGCALERLTLQMDGTEQWQGVAHSTTQDGNGQFAVHGAVEPGRLRLTFGSYGALPMPPVEFAAGTKDLEVRVARGHELAACILQTRGTPEEVLHALLLPNEPHPELDAIDDGRERFRAEPWTEDGEHLHLQWRALPAGSYTLAVHLWTRAEPLVVVRDVQVPGPAGGDVRLAAIDLRTALRTVTVHLFDVEGNPLDTSAIAFARAAPDAAEWSGQYLWEASSTVVVPAGDATELLIGANGYQPRRVLVDGPTLDVRLERWPTVRIDVADMPALPAGTTVYVSLEPETPNHVPYRTQSSNGTLDEVLDVPGSTRVVDGHAEAAIGPGPHLLELTVGTPKCYLSLTGTEPKRVLPTSQRVRVTVPPTEWARALADVADSSK